MTIDDTRKWRNGNIRSLYISLIKLNRHVNRSIFHVLAHSWRWRLSMIKIVKATTPMIANDGCRDTRVPSMTTPWWSVINDFIDGPCTYNGSTCRLSVSFTAAGGATSPKTTRPRRRGGFSFLYTLPVNRRIDGGQGKRAPPLPKKFGKNIFRTVFT